MDLIHMFMNVAVPPIVLVLLILILPIFLVFKLVRSIKRSICSENVAGKVVLITGAASGIGEQIAYEYARRGAFLVLVDIIEDNLMEVSNTSRRLGSPDVLNIVADVSKVEDCRRFIDEAVNHFGQLDHLVNNAGTVKAKKFERINQISDHHSIMDVNFWGTINGIHFAIPHLKKTRGKIVVISSICGWYPLPTLSIYSASKAALMNFCEALRTELGSTIGITVVTPGLIKTKMSHDWRNFKSIMPEESAESCAKAIVRSACRGDSYLMEPSWIRWLFPMKVTCPEVVEWCNRLLVHVSYKRNGVNERTFWKEN